MEFYKIVRKRNIIKITGDKSTPKNTETNQNITHQFQKQFKFNVRHRPTDRTGKRHKHTPMLIAINQSKSFLGAC